jgi:hypothetical protein
MRKLILAILFGMPVLKVLLWAMAQPLLPASQLDGERDYDTCICLCEAKPDSRDVSLLDKAKNTARITVLTEEGNSEQIDVFQWNNGYGAAIKRDKLWDPGTTLVIQFLDNPVEQKLLQAVSRFARNWEKYANLRFVFVPAGKTPQDLGFDRAEIRISFKEKASWSFIGKDCVHSPAERSMGLKLTAASKPVEIQQTVLHEFGHALGFIHEHQSPAAGIRWKQPDAMNY